MASGAIRKFSIFELTCMYIIMAILAITLNGFKYQLMNCSILSLLMTFFTGLFFMLTRKFKSGTLVFKQNSAPAFSSVTISAIIITHVFFLNFIAVYIFMTVNT